MKASEVTDHASGGFLLTPSTNFVTPTSNIKIRNSTISNNDGPVVKGTLFNVFELTGTTANDNVGAVADMTNSVLGGSTLLFSNNVFQRNGRGIILDTSATVDTPPAPLVGPINYEINALIEKNKFLATGGTGVAAHTRTGTVTVSKNVFADGTGTAIAAFGQNPDGAGTLVVSNNHFVRNAQALGSVFRWENGLPPAPVAPASLGVSNISFNGNLFNRNSTTDGEGAVLHFDGSTGLLVGTSSGNNFVANTGAYLLTTTMSVFEPDLDVTSNWWGTSVNRNAVQALILDYTNDPNRALANFDAYPTQAIQGAPISAPISLTATPNGAGQVDLAWPKVIVGDCAGYRIYHDVDSGYPYANVVSVPGCNTLSTSITGLSAGTRYFTITAIDGSFAGDGTDINEGHESWHSAQVQATVP